MWENARPGVDITGISYLHIRPRLTFADGSSRVWNADRLRAELGIAFTVFQRR
jgi:hypothetical protein